MLTLSFDTATASLSLALTDATRVLVNMASVGERRHAERLLPAIDEWLHAQNKSLDDVDLIVVGNGPGSYTGIRIALATALGFALGETALVTVSTLQGMAAGLDAADGDLLVPVMDARGGRLFAAVYAKGEESDVPAQRVILPDHQTTLADFVTELNDLVSKKDGLSTSGTIILAGSGARPLADAIPQTLAWRARVRVVETCWPDAAQMARLGEQRFLAEGGMASQAVRPFYAAKTQAERMAGR